MPPEEYLSHCCHGHRGWHEGGHWLADGGQTFCHTSKKRTLKWDKGRRIEGEGMEGVGGS